MRAEPRLEPACVEGPGSAPWVPVRTGNEIISNQRLRLSIKGMTDSNLVTSLYVNEVSVQTRCKP